MEPEGLLSCSQEPATEPYPESDESSHILTPYVRSILKLSSHLFLGLESGFFASYFLNLFYPNSISWGVQIV